jgi:3-oxoacyl-[acyl-carrier protein] reductase
MDGFSRTLATELGPHGIRVNVIAPGFTATDATAHLPVAVGDGFAAQAPLRRVAQPEDVARAVLFYCTELAGFVTGTYLNVCGGQQMD